MGADINKNANCYMLCEDGKYLLCEDGGKIII